MDTRANVFTHKTLTGSFKVNKGGINLANGLYYETRASEKTWDHSFITNIDKDISEKLIYLQRQVLTAEETHTLRLVFNTTDS